MGRLLGLDFGDRRFGLAWSDPSRTIARPLEVVEGETRLFERIRELAGEEGLDAVVLGVPRNMDGSLGPKAEQVLAFGERLAAATGLEVVPWDERLTTVQAERRLRAGGARRDRQRREVDRVAAQILLQSYLDQATPPGPGRDAPAAP